MNLRAILPPVAAVAAGVALALLYHRSGPAPVAGENAGLPLPQPTPPPPAGGTMHHPAGAEGPEPPKAWQAKAVQPLKVPRTESVRAKVEGPDPVPVTSETRAQVAAILVKPGQAVEKGELLVRLDGRTWEKERDAARKAGDAARVAKAERALAGLEIRAPVAGRVHRIDAELGMMPMRGPKGAFPLVVLFEPPKMVFTAEVPAPLAAGLAPGTQVFLRAGDDLPGTGKVESVGEPGPGGTRRVVARAEDLPGNSAAPGGEGELLLVTGVQEVLVVPETAVALRGEQPVVWVVRVTSDLEERKVRLGRRLPGAVVEVLDGVKRFESVAIPDAK